MTSSQILIDRLRLYAARALAVTLGVIASAFPSAGESAESSATAQGGDDFITIR